MIQKYSLLSCLFVAVAFCAAQSSSPAPETKDDPPGQPAATSQQTAPDAPSSAQAPKADSAKPDPQNSGSPEAGSQDQKDGQKAGNGDGQGKNEDPRAGISNDRLFYTLPNFLTLENTGQVPPLTTGQKFSVIARTSFDPVQIPWYGFLAAVSQAENSERGYGQGWVGYGKRFSAYAADGTIENFMVGAILPSILREDPRYFQSGHGSFWHRTWYSVSRIAVTRTDSGHNSFNISEIAGSGIASAISNYGYHPSEDRTVGNMMSVWGSQVGYDAIAFVAKEFWPDIRRKMEKHSTQ